jgi:hypothetical protein
MRVRTIPSYLALSAILLAAGCSGDNPLGVNSGDQLTAAEIQSLFGAMSAAFAGGGVTPAPGVQPSAAAIPIDQSFNFSSNCPLGGSVGIAGSANGEIDEQTLAGNLTMNFAYRLNECAVSGENATFTVSHDPEIVFTGEYVFSQEEISVSGSQEGGFVFTADDGRSGSCLIDLDFSVSYNNVTQASSATVSGTVCGMSGDQFSPVDLSGSS